MSRAFALLTTAALLAGSLLTTAVAPVAANDTPQSCGIRPIDLVMIIDRSGSMDTDEGAHERLEWAQLAANDLVTALDGNGGVGSSGIHRVGVSSFAGNNASTEVELSAAANATTIASAINSLSANGGTPFELGMAEGADNMSDGARDTHDGVDVSHVLIFLSDGNPDPNSYAPDGTQIAAYLATADKAYAIAIGADGGDLGSGGTGVDYDLMKSISKPNPSAFRAVTSGSGLPAIFSEIYEELACPTGTIEVIKHLAPANDPGRFDLWIGGEMLADEAGHNGTTGAQNLLAGTYTVGETADGETNLANYTSDISCVDTANNNAQVFAELSKATNWDVSLSDGQAIQCTITNTRKSGTLNVNKIVTNDDGGQATCDDFGFKINGGATIGFEADCSNAITLPTGTYDVTEPASNGYETSYDGCDQIAVVAGQAAWCTVVNDDKPGTLTVVKELTTDDGGDATCADFSFKVNDANPVTFEADCSNSMTVDAGTYSVVETDADGYTASYDNCSALRIPNGGSATCTIGNDDQPGTLKVTKTIVGGDAEFGDFSFKVNGDGPVAFEADGSNELTVPAGGYSVTEVPVPGWDTSYENCAQLWIPNGGSQTCEITNTRQTGTLEVVKQLSPTDDPGRFGLIVDGALEAADVSNGGTTGDLVLETGIHTVGEAAGTATSLANYASAIECRADGGQGSVIASAAGIGPLEVNVTDGADVLCVISNQRVSVSIDKASDAGDNAAVQPGQSIHFTLTVSVNNGTATNVVISDELPDGLTYVDGSATPAAGFSASDQDLEWLVGSLGAGSHSFEYDAAVDADAHGSLENLGCVDADQNAAPIIHEDAIGAFQHDELVCDETTSQVQRVSIDKTNGSPIAVVPGSVVEFTVSLNVENGPVPAVSVVDQLPEGLGDVTDISDGGIYDAATNRISWNLVDVADGMALTYKATVAEAAEAGEYVNVATITDGPCVEASCEDDSSVSVRVPTLVVDKTADVETIVISGPSDALVATPSVVTWTISWTLTDGPVSNAVISDELPGGLVFLDATDGGTFADGAVTWTFPTLTSSGSVSFRTTVDPAAISRAEPTVNVASIDSDETAPDEGEDSVAVSVEPPPLAGNPTPTPKPELPDTAIGSGQRPTSVPYGLLAFGFIGSLAALAVANVKARSRRR